MENIGNGIQAQVSTGYIQLTTTNNNIIYLDSTSIENLIKLYYQSVKFFENRSQSSSEEVTIIIDESKKAFYCRKGHKKDFAKQICSTCRRIANQRYQSKIRSAIKEHKDAIDCIDKSLTTTGST